MRSRTVLNRGWRFTLGDPSEAELPPYDDSGWEPVGLPHSFSIPYFQATDFYVGPGWYRRELELDTTEGTLQLEFEAAFQDARVYVNGVEVGSHRGGYTGFVVDISDAVRPGSNLVAVRVDNTWDPTLAPLGGEHVFSGGLYRDVWLEQTDAVHVAWNGISVTTPGLEDGVARVHVEVEIENDTADAVDAAVQLILRDSEGKELARAESPQQTFPPGSTQVVVETEPLTSPELWSPETPVMYAVQTVLRDAGGLVHDEVTTPFGFRYFDFDAHTGFSLNGVHRYLLGANVHQDQSGWGDAVTNGSIRRDLLMMKEAGFDFIRGSHYPHDPVFTEVADEIGLLVWSEGTLWGTAPAGGSPWAGGSYPTDERHRAAFEQSVKQQLEEMILANRNHPSVVVWSVGNEAFFADPAVMPEVRRLIGELVDLARKLDPTRPAAVGGAQRGDTDRLGDLAGYNGDGAWLFPDPGIPNLVSEYSSTSTQRPGEYSPGWGDLTKDAESGETDPYPWRLPWRSGEVIWCGFDHGSVAGPYLGSMGIVDYARLPKRAWYWYRRTYRGIEPPAWPQPGTPAGLLLTADKTELSSSDGTDDSHVIVTVVDSDGRHIAHDLPVTLTITSGPGEFATGLQLDFAPDGPNPIRDGTAAAFFRSYHCGTTVITAQADGLPSTSLSIQTTAGPVLTGPNTVPLRRVPPAATVIAAPTSLFGIGNPTDASSNHPDHVASCVNDGRYDTWWQNAENDTTPWIAVHLERLVTLRVVRIALREPAIAPIAVDYATDRDTWHPITVVPPGTLDYNIPVDDLPGTAIRLTTTAPLSVTSLAAEGTS
ncbi:glycoside hydrolase family 2 TIM barrel-domain containing protein [Kribbella sp. NPDC000426]|uniref:glycoside hydrolase family 2 protein n=1 Tax=Kribbella sp. NPDC000426 TaxID=3154255 RepID=UPI0033241E49